MNSGDWSTISSSMRGRWLANSPMFFVLVPFWFALSVLTPPEIDDAAAMGLIALAHLGSLSACTLVFFLVRATLLRRRESSLIALPVVLLSGALIGATKGAVTVGMLFLLLTDYDPTYGLSTRLVPATIIGMLLLPGGALVLATRERYRIERSVLIAEAVRRSVLSSQPMDGPDARGLHPRSRAALIAFIIETRQKLSAPSADVRALSEDITESIHDRLRPVSHEIWARESQQLGDFSLPDLIRSAAIDRKFPILTIVIFTALSGFPLMLATTGVVEGIARVSLFALTAGSLFAVAKSVPTFTVLGGALNLTAAIVLSTVANDVAARLIFGEVGSGLSLTLPLAIGITLALNTVLFSIIRAAADDRDRIRARLTAIMSPQQLSDAIVRIQSQLLNREFAYHLHSNVQNALLTAALRLNTPRDTANPGAAGQAKANANANANRDAQKILAELAALESLLDGVTDSRAASAALPVDAMLLSGSNIAMDARKKSSTATEPSLTDRLSDSAAVWDGLVGTTVSVNPPEATVSARMARTAASIVSEAVANAHRHGRATEITVTATLDAHKNLHLTCLDNGVGPRAGRIGLGSALYDATAGSQWSLQLGPTGVGSLLSITVFLED
jgi:hypothetical protein